MELELLPSDVWSSIFLLCKTKAIYRLVQVSRTFHSIINTEKFWYLKFQQSYDEPGLQVQSWREAYRNYGTIWLQGQLVCPREDMGIDRCNLAELNPKAPNLLPIQAKRLVLTDSYLLAIDPRGRLHIMGSYRNNRLGVHDLEMTENLWDFDYVTLKELVHNDYVDEPIKEIAGARDISLFLTEAGDVLLNNEHWSRLRVIPFDLDFDFKAKQIYACDYDGFVIIDKDDYPWVMHSSHYLVLNSGLDIGYGQRMNKLPDRVKQYAVSGARHFFIDMNDNSRFYGWKADFVAGIVQTRQGTYHHKAKHVAYKNSYSVLIDPKDKLFVAGRNTEGQLGLDSDQEIIPHNTPVPDLSAKQVVCCSTYILVLDFQGQVWGSGYANHIDLISRKFIQLWPEKKVLRIYATEHAIGLLLHPNPVK